MVTPIGPTLPNEVETINRSILLKELCGIGYMLASVGLSVYSLMLLYPYLDNNFIWSQYTSANVLSSLVNIYNMQLTLMTNSTQLDLFDPSTSISVHDHVGVSHNYPRLIMYRDLTTLEAGVQGLRNTALTSIVYMLTQYCWVDFERRWAMAHTTSRQERCWRNYKQNSAVYMETILRNINFKSWVKSTEGLFDVRIAAGVLEFDSGATFIEYLKDHEMLSIDNEVAYLVNQNMTTFELQYSNQYQIGMHDTIQIENALAATWSLPIKNIESWHRGTQFTTKYMYSGLQFDWFVPTGNMSLVQNASTFFGRFDDNMIEKYSVMSPLTAQFAAIHKQLGPLVTIDLHLVPPPWELLEAVVLFRSILQAYIETNEVFAAKLASVELNTFYPTPLKWKQQSLRFYGGNPMCGFGSPQLFVQESFGFDDACATQKRLAIQSNPYNSMFAYLLLDDKTFDACQLLPPMEVSTCQNVMMKLKSIISVYDIHAQLINIPKIQELQLSFVQLVSVIGNDTISLEKQLLLTSDFAFFGWMAVYDWMYSEREVVSFEGDYGTYTLMSYATLPYTPSDHTNQSNMAIYTWYCCAVVSGGLFGVAIILLIQWLVHRPLGSPWFMCNRIVSSTWLNRSFLIIRGVAAVVCLSSATELPQSDRNGVHFTDTPRSLLASCLFAGEATWITYVMHDMLHPFTGEYTKRYAPLSSCISWAVLAAIDTLLPIRASVQIERNCHSKNMDQMIYCSSGTVVIGSCQRMNILLAVLVLSVPICYFIDKQVRRKMIAATTATPSLLMPSGALAFINPTLNDMSTGYQINFVTAAMLGTLVLRISDWCLLFDIKLWYSLPSDLFKIKNSTIFLPHCLQEDGKCGLKKKKSSLRTSSFGIVLVEKRGQMVIVIVGIAYVVASLVSSVAYFTVTDEFLSNDFGWTGFNSTGMHAYLGNIVNKQLLLNTSQVLDFNDSKLIEIDQLYNTTTSSISLSFNAPRRQLFDTFISLKSVVQGLRNMNPCMLPWMSTQYCYLDFGRQWTMVRTTKRLARCTSASTNGAVYLEAPLRNIYDWKAWEYCWGHSFKIGFTSYLQTSQSGQEWLTSIQSNTRSVDEEVAVWLHHNITNFQLQWQNYKSIGLTNTLRITSALGLSSLITLSAFEDNFHPRQQTSMRMYWGLASDLWAISNNSTSIGGSSLIVSSPLHAFANVSSESLLYENLTLANPLPQGLVLLQSIVGPFGSVDMHYILPPAELLALYTAFLQSVHELLRSNPRAQMDYMDIPTKSSSCEVPPFLLSDPDIMSNGGNIMCGNDVPFEPAFAGLLSGFGSASVCHAEFLEVLKISTIESLFALLTLAQGNISSVDVNGICSLDVCAGSACTQDINATLGFLEQYNISFLPLHNLTRYAVASVYALDINVIQYYTTLNDTATTLLYQINVVEPSEPSWTYYGWALVYEWITGAREVVEFRGDSGSIVSITYGNLPINTTPDPAEIPQSYAAIFSGCTLVVSWTIVSIACIVSICSIVYRGHLEGWNLFEMNRIIGNVWAGRTFLLVRSVTAMWILNTAPLTLTRHGHITYIESPNLPWYKTILASSEVTWFVYVLNDILSVISKQYTMSYATKSSLSTWFIITILTLASPLQYTAILHQECLLIDMDSALVCVSGELQIGSIHGIGNMALIAMICVVTSYCAERAFFQRREALKIHTSILNAHALYMLELSNWKFESEYYLDTTSAVMAGLLSFEYNNKLNIFDVKSWRLISIPIAGNQPSGYSLQPCDRSIPLSRI